MEKSDMAQSDQQSDQDLRERLIRMMHEEAMRAGKSVVGAIQDANLLFKYVKTGERP